MVAEINLAAEKGNVDETWRLLSKRDANIEDLNPKLKRKYCEAIRVAIRQKETKREACKFLTHSEIQNVIDEVNGEEEQAGIERWKENVIVDFQARARGFLVRQRLFNMLQYYYDREDQVIRAQAVWRGVKGRRLAKSLAAERAKNQPQFRPLAFYRRHERKICAIQRAWRQYMIKKDFESLMKSKEMDLPVVRKYLHLLDMRNEDFDQELQLQTLKGEISKAIRLNTQLEKDIDAMDIKIGLLVKNRISGNEVNVVITNSLPNLIGLYFFQSKTS
jgi:hypothetical protein